MIRISLIIATYNRAEPLMETLRSVAEQSLGSESWECIVVNNNSQDNTEELFQRFAERYPTLNLRMVCEPKQGLSYARNCGISVAKGDIIAIIDDDERVNREFLSAYLELFDKYRDAMSAGGRVIAEYNESPRPKWMSPYTERPIANPMNFGKSIRLFPKGAIPAGGNMAFRREVFERFGLFNPQLGRVGERLIGGEESDLFERLSAAKCPCYYVPNAIMWHIIPKRKLSDEYFDTLCYNIGVSQRVRAELSGSVTGLKLRELLKWAASVVLAFGYLLTFRGKRARYLLRMRRQISKGIYNKRRGR